MPRKNISRNKAVSRRRKISRSRKASLKREKKPLRGGNSRTSFLASELERYRVFRSSEEQLYRELAEGTYGETTKGAKNGFGKGKLKMECSPSNKKPIRCSVDSLAPGICVPDENMCYDHLLGVRYQSDLPEYKAVREAVKSLGQGEKYSEFVKSASGQQLTDDDLRKMIVKYRFNPFTKPEFIMTVGK